MRPEATNREKVQALLLADGGAELLTHAGYDLEGARAAHVTEECSEVACQLCGILECPFGEPFHYDEDGCPACMDDPDVRAFVQSGGLEQIKALSAARRKKATPKPRRGP